MLLKIDLEIVMQKAVIQVFHEDITLDGEYQAQS